MRYGGKWGKNLEAEGLSDYIEQSVKEEFEERVGCSRNSWGFRLFLDCGATCCKKEDAVGKQVLGDGGGGGETVLPE